MTEELLPVLEGKYLPEERILIEAALVRDGQTFHRALALNDAVLSRGGAGQMIEFEVFINQEFVYTQRSDGLIVSTPPAPPPTPLLPAAPSCRQACTPSPSCPSAPNP